MGKICCSLILLFILPSGFVLMVYNRALDLGMYEVSNNII